MFMFWTHSGLRYLVYLAGLLTLAYAVYGAVRKQPYDRTMARLSTAFAWLIHINILVGVGVLFTGRFGPAVTGHIMVMVFAAAAAQVVPSVMRGRRPSERSYLPHVVGTLVALALVVVGVVALGRPVFGGGAG